MRFRLYELKYIVAIIAMLLLLAWITSCNPTRQASRKLQRAERLIEQAKILDPSIITTDSIKVIDTLLIEAVRHDTTFIDATDTVIIEKDRLKVKYFRDTLTNTVYLEGECKADTVIKEILVPVEHYIYKESLLEKIGVKRTWQKILFWIFIVVAFSIALWAKIKP